MTQFEAITLTQKKDKQGKVTSYSVNISKREAASCGFLEVPTIKLIDEQSKTVTVKAKGFTVDENILTRVIEAKKSLSNADFCGFLLYFDIEILTDLVMLMYIGQEQDLNMGFDIGIERFLHYYSDHVKLVSGKNSEELADILVKKAPLATYLQIGFDLITEKGE